jgi:hypothetical protein
MGVAGVRGVFPWSARTGGWGARHPRRRELAGSTVRCTGGPPRRWGPIRSPKGDRCPRDANLRSGGGFRRRC